MSKFGNVLKMLVLLKSRKKMKINEIASELETTERQVRRYKDDLEQAGIYIDSIPGKYGGYVYKEKDYLIELNLTNEEYSVLLMALEQLKYDDFICYKDFKFIVEKINILRNNDSSQEFQTEYFIKDVKANCDYEKEKEMWTDINAAIITKNKINIKYHSLKTGIKERTIHPYAVFQYRSSMYFVGYCELRHELREFKVSRIDNYQVLNEKFEKAKNFNLKNYMKNCFGIFKDKEINVKLKIKYPMSQIVKEKVWVEDQKITDISKDKSIIYEAKMRGITEIKSWILSMGSSVEVVEPIDLKQEIKKEINDMVKIYGKN